MKKIIFILLLSLILPNAKIKSLILPGWGELSIDKQSRAKYFLYAESILIISAYSFNKLSSSYRSDYTAYAIQHANVDITNRDYMFALDIGSNDNIEEFNNIKKRQRALLMELDPGGNVVRDFGHQVYPERAGYDWDWDSDTNRSTFNSMRINSINYEKYAGFAVAGMLLNRIVSLIDVMILENKEETKISSIIIPKGYDGMELQFYIKF
tara:strand:+ start:678 stop:1307 length:630 start_codon:yes stop_codon:yes gene_type:complete